MDHPTKCLFLVGAKFTLKAAWGIHFLKYLIPKLIQLLMLVHRLKKKREGDRKRKMKMKMITMMIMMMKK